MGGGGLNFNLVALFPLSLTCSCLIRETNINWGSSFQHEYYYPSSMMPPLISNPMISWPSRESCDFGTESFDGHFHPEYTIQPNPEECTIRPTQHPFPTSHGLLKCTPTFHSLTQIHVISYPSVLLVFRSLHLAVAPFRCEAKHATFRSVQRRPLESQPLRYMQLFRFILCYASVVKFRCIPEDFCATSEASRVLGSQALICHFGSTFRQMTKLF